MNPQDNQTPQATSPQQQAIERLRTAVNVLVTVSNNPSVDQLAGAIGFTLLLNKLGKHATTVFSGTVPSTLEFLKPDDTIEKNTDSLRDFIVSLDKSKADKLRYKVEQNVVKIFITPYHTSISQKDLEFSQGDFNMDVVLGLGISDRKDLDQAITAHGRILHDATVITVSVGSRSSTLGAINWSDPSAASLCEMLVGVGEALQPNLLDTQQATAFLTGIVSETERFSNEKTTPKIMSLASQLMAAGANQQLIATQLEKVTEVPLKSVPATELATQSAANVPAPDGALNIEHDDENKPESAPSEEKKDEVIVPAAEPHEVPAHQIAIDEHGNMSPAPADSLISRHRIIEPISHQADEGGNSEEENPFTANSHKEGDNEDSDLTPPHVLERDKETLSHEKADNVEPMKEEPAPAPVQTFMPAPEVKIPEPTVLPKVEMPSVPAPAAEVLTLPPAMDDNTLHELEKNLDSPHFVKDPTTTLHEMEEFVDSSHLTAQPTGDLVMTPPVEGVDAARDAVNSAISAAPYDPTRPQPLQAVNSIPLHDDSVQAQPAGDTTTPATSDLVLPPIPTVNDPVTVSDPSGQSPPPVPPPMIPMQ